MNTKRGLFITFEGGDGSGKSVQSKILYDSLASKGLDVVLTREPGGTTLSETIRGMVLTGETDKWDPKTEALLYLAARADHWHRKIKPSLNLNKIVICDRFHDSSVVYQGICKGVDINLLNSILSNITDGRFPDRTYLISIDPEIGLKRSLEKAGNVETRLEKMGVEFHRKVYKAFLEIAAANSSRFLNIDGNASINEISEIIEMDVSKILRKV